MKYLIVLLVGIFFSISFPQGITLRDTTNQYDYIIITIPEFVQSCQSFKQHKESYSGFNVLIVDTGQIYSEFNSELYPEQNIREFISYSGTFWKSPKPKYFVFIGNTNAVPNFKIQSIYPMNNPYQRSDYPYSISLFDPDTISTEFLIGRLPAILSSEAENYFNKLIWYETNNTLFDWMNNNLFICESDSSLMYVNHSIAVAQNLPAFFNSKIYEDDDSAAYYGSLDSVFNYINNNGSSIVWFTGRSSDSTFMTNPEFMSISDLISLDNYQKYFLSIFLSQTAILDSNSNISREMLFKENTGSIGAIVASVDVFWPTIAILRREWAKRFYTTDHYPIPEVINTSLDFMMPYQRSVINYWGDPSLILKYDLTVNVEGPITEIPEDFFLFSNYPNPFNATTNIKYQVPFLSNVTLKIYDILGKEVATLVDEQKQAGKYEIGFTDNYLTSGIYFYTLRAGNYTQTKKMILLK